MRGRGICTEESEAHIHTSSRFYFIQYLLSVGILIWKKNNNNNNKKQKTRNKHKHQTYKTRNDCVVKILCNRAVSQFFVSPTDSATCSLGIQNVDQICIGKHFVQVENGLI